MLRRRDPSRTIRCILALVIVALLAQAAVALAASPAPATAPASAAAALKNPQSYGLWVLTPAIVAILCAALTRQVVPSLLLGVIVASAMLLPCMTVAESYGPGNAAARVTRLTVEKFILGATINRTHMQIMLFTLLIGATVGVIDANGGTRALVDVIARRARTQRLGQITAWVAGLVVFFDDYANTMIVGPTMQPICDRLKVSRAKLAYIVDSTAAPVASIALIGTWVGAEVGYIQDGMKALAANGATPHFLVGIDGWRVFVNSLPYRFYPILAIMLVLLIAVSGRDFGPMLRSEKRAGTSEKLGSGVVADHERGPSGRWWMAAGPIGVLVAVTFGILLWPGLFGRAPGEPLTVQAVFAAADAYTSILYGAVFSVVTAVVLTVLSRRGSMKTAVDAGMEGMARVFPAIVVLVFAWALAEASKELQVGDVVRAWLAEKNFSIQWLPVTVFASAALVSFATGTSWGTMGILCPMVVTVAAGLAEPLGAEDALPLFYASVGSVLAGSIFGDHCSPISDTTVLSAIASGCTLEEHVWTQIPYALVAAVVGMGSGDILCNRLGFPPWVGIGVGTLILGLVVWHLGRPIDRQSNRGATPYGR